MCLENFPHFADPDHGPDHLAPFFMPALYSAGCRARRGAHRLRFDFSDAAVTKCGVSGPTNPRVFLDELFRTDHNLSVAEKIVSTPPPPLRPLPMLLPIRVGQVGFGPVVWLIISEIFPLELR